MVYQLVMVNMATKFDQDTHNGLVSITFLRSICDTEMDARTDGMRGEGTKEVTLYPLSNALCENNYSMM